MSPGLLDLLAELRSRSSHFELGSFRPDTIMVTVAVPGERWEVEFLVDGSVEAEVFASRGQIETIDHLEDLLERHTDRSQA